MRAITIARFGGPEVLVNRDDLPLPEAGPDDVLVRVAYAGVNFMDVHTRQGKYASSTTYPVRLPSTMGREGAGVIVGCGARVQHLSLGDRVAWCISWGSYAEYARVPAYLAARIPDAVGLDVAAAAMFQGCTAHYLINDVGAIRAGMSCLVHAGSGNIGQLLIQMAKARSAYVFATASNEPKRAVAILRGADQALPYENFAVSVRKATEGKGVDVAFDSLGETTLRDTFKATRIRGLVVNYGNVSGSVTNLDPIELGEAGSLFLTRPRLADHMRDHETVQRRADAVFGAIASGALYFSISERYTLDDVHIGLDRIELRSQIGKSIVCVSAS